MSSLKVRTQSELALGSGTGFGSLHPGIRALLEEEN